MTCNVIPVRPILDIAVRGLCLRHPKGCPNYGEKDGCPPKAPLFEQVYDLREPVYAIVHRFDLGGHVARMRQKHPNWSQRQLECCLYWQAGARKELMRGIKEFLREHHGYSVTTTPEAMGVDVAATLANSGICLEWPPVTAALQVALAGIKRQGKGFVPLAHF